MLKERKTAIHARGIFGRLRSQTDSSWRDPSHFIAVAVLVHLGESQPLKETKRRIVLFNIDMNRLACLASLINQSLNDGGAYALIPVLRDERDVEYSDLVFEPRDPQPSHRLAV